MKMIRPNTMDEFKALIKSMSHRERFVFEAVKRDENGDIWSVEIYATEVNHNMSGSDMNIKVSLVDICGKTCSPVPKHTISKYLRLFKENWWNMLYNELIK